MNPSTIVRCKHHKKPPGDGGVVDGCGWQGPLPVDGKCPRCGSGTLQVLRHVAATPSELSLLMNYVTHAIHNGYGLKPRRSRAERLCKEVLAPLIEGTAAELRVVARKRTPR